MSTKVFKKGEYLFKEGDKISSVYLIQQGGVSLCLNRGKKVLDLFQLGSGQLLGDQILIGTPTHATSAVSTTETTVLEVPIDALKQQYDGATQVIKAIVKSLAERLKQAMNEVKGSRLEKDQAPCPEDQVAKVFGSVFHTINHKGDKSKEGRIIINWTLLKQYAQRVFGESPKRLEQAINILVKLKLALYELGKNPENPDGPDEIIKVHFLDTFAIENFFEFYQYYYFKSGKSDILKTDDFAMLFLDSFIKLAGIEKVDRFGVVHLEFSKVLDYFKNEHSLNLSNDHFSRLEQKGVFCKRSTVNNVVTLQFEPKEFVNISNTWKILKEIEKWNEKGFVDMEEKDDKSKKKKPGAPACPQCHAEVASESKFCSECGHKLTASAA